MAALVTKVALRIRWVEACIIRLCDTNTMVRPAAAIASSTNHHHGSITTAPVTPEGQVIIASNVAVSTVQLTEALSVSVGATIGIYRTTSTTCVAVPGGAISEVTEAGNKASKGSPTGTASSFE